MIDGLDVVGEIVGAVLEVGADLADLREKPKRPGIAGVIFAGIVVSAAIGASLLAIFAIGR